MPEFIKAIGAARFGVMAGVAAALTAFFLYVNRFFAPIQLLVQQYNTFQQGRASVFKLQDLLENEPSVLESPTATELPPISSPYRI